MGDVRYLRNNYSLLRLYWLDWFVVEGAQDRGDPYYLLKISTHDVYLLFEN